MAGKRTLIAGWTIWLVWMTVFAGGRALAGECPNVVHYTLRNLIYSDCEVRSSGQHFVFRIDKSDFFSAEVAASVLNPVPAAGGPIPYFTPVYYGFYESATGDACALISYPLNDVTEIVGTSGNYYCLVASESNTAGGREQRISGQWFLVPGSASKWEGIRMTDSAIPWSLTLDSSGSGSGTIGGAGSYVVGESISLTANADTGSTFTGWSGDAACASSFTMPDRDVSCTANFTLNSHAVSTSSAGTGSGSTGGDGTYDFGSTVTLTASPDTGSTFTGWSGHPLCAASFTMPDEAVSCTATFSLNSYAITTTASPAEGGAIDCSPNPVDHGSDSTCTASANLGYTFSGFSGDCSGTTCGLTNVTSIKSVTANFTLNSHAVSTSSEGTGSGSTGGDGTYDFGSTVTLTASPDTGSTFTGWSGHPLCAASFTMPNEAVSCTATFTLNSYAITTSAIPAAGGTVDCSPNPVDHGGDSICTTTATPGEGYEFAGFSGDCSGMNCSLLAITSPKDVTAHFEPVTEIVRVTRAGSEASLSVSGPGCRIVEGEFVAAPSGGPANVTFPFGLLDFTLKGCTGEAVVTVTYPTTLPSKPGYWKEDDGVFSRYPAAFSGNSVTFTLVDNGSGDSDPTVGTIRDASGVGFASVSAIHSIPLLSPWSTIALALFMALIGVWRIANLS